MNRLLFSLMALPLLAPSGALAASVRLFSTYHPETYTVYLSGGAEDGVATSLSFLATPSSGSSFTNISGTGTSGGIARRAGAPFTFRNALLTLSPDDEDNTGGLGWTVIGVTTSASQVAFGGGPLGRTISTASQPHGLLFLASLRVSQGSSFGVSLSLGGPDGQLAHLGAIPFLTLPLDPNLVPEPNASAIIGCSVVSLLAFRRRS